MKTLYLRNVPDEVSEALEELATRAGMSTSAFAVKELTEVARRVRNREIFDSAPNVDIPMSVILETIHEGRSER